MSNLYRWPSIDASYQVSVHLAKWFQRRFFRNRPIRKTRITYCGHVCKRINPKLTIAIEDLPYMPSTKFRFFWPSGFREDFFRNRPIRNNNCLWRPCFLMNQAEMSNLYKGPFIYASYQVSVFFLAMQFQRRRFFRNQPIRNKNCMCSHVCYQIGTKWTIFIEDLT